MDHALPLSFHCFSVPLSLLASNQRPESSGGSYQFVIMSDPVQQQQQVQQQSQTLPLPSVQSKGSFGTSFIVLAVIIVVSAAACFLSRLCNKRGQKKQKQPKQDKNHQQKNGQGDAGGPTFPTQQSRRNEMGMEFGFGARVGPVKGNDFEIGFDKRFPGGKGAPPPPNADMMRGQRPNHPIGVTNGAAIPPFNGARWPGRQ